LLWEQEIFGSNPNSLTNKLMFDNLVFVINMAHSANG